MIYRLLTGSADWAGTPAGVAVRALLAALTAAAVCLAAGPRVIACLRALKVGERTETTPIEDEAMRKSIAGKSGTPTMGGVMLLAALLVAVLLWGNPANPALLLAAGTALCLGLAGALDDVLKLRGLGHRGRGLKPRHKLAAQFAIGALSGLALSAWAPAPARWLPSPMAMAAGLPLIAAAWSALVIATFSNATNITDGLDGLLAGLAAMAAAALGLACWVAGRGPEASAGVAELAVFCGAMLGACLGFLWFNRHPARVFMGDTGSLAIGAGLAATALAASHEILLGLVGLVFLVEFASSLLQIGCFKVFRRRILPCAPLHHTFQKRGDPETRIVRGFYLCGAVAALFALNILWL